MTRLEKCICLQQRGYTYNKETGKIYGIHGKEIKSKSRYGYIKLKPTNTIDLKGHHFAWYMTYGNVNFDMLDHINHIRDDNRIENLRIVSQQQNMWNKTAKGYTWNKKENKWQCQIGRNGMVINLGLYDSEEEASSIYIIAKKICDKIYEKMLRMPN